MSILIAFLAFFVIIAVRGWQWRGRRNRKKVVALAGGAAKGSERVDYPAGYENVSVAWDRAISLAPQYRNDLLNARATCAALVAATERQGGIPDDAMIETATLLHNYLAALVDSTARHLRGAKPSQKEAIIAEMVRFLQGFARRAQQDMRAVGFGADEEDSALRAHLAAQLFQ
jgi:hypothetical protein